MNCPDCQEENPADAKFCMKCGAALSSSCPECGTELPAGAQFCYKCGHRMTAPEPQTEPVGAGLQQYIPQELLAKLESARSGGMAGERRVVTILFCDVKGSTEAAEGLDPEEWAEIINGAFEYLIAPVYRYEGTLARLMGDAILAFFGAPIAHEDDPQRAVLAGLDIVSSISSYREQVKERWGLDFDVRVGINTGLVVVGEVGSDLRVEYTALGDAVNLASRMEQTAEPGTVHISENTHKLIAPLFEFKDLDPIEVKGKSEPVRAYGVLGPKADPGRLRGIEGLDAPLIGREEEIKRLANTVDDLGQGRGAIVSVMGEAGLGKSRLIAELRASLVSNGSPSPSRGESDEEMVEGGRKNVGWYEARSLSYESSTPYAPFIDLFIRSFAIRAESADAENYGVVKAKVAELLPDQAEGVAPFIATLLGLELEGDEAQRIKYLEPPQLRDGIFAAVCDFFTKLSEMGPIVLVFEDLHWIDPTSLDLIERLMELTDRVGLVIMALFRPWRGEPSWRYHEKAQRDYGHRYTSVLLEPLDEDYSRMLVGSLLHVEDLPEKVRALILAKAEGNPFFVEEVIRSLLDAKLVVRENSHWRATREIENIALPDTLAGVITARLDRLDEESKLIAQTASVIGREFGFKELADVHEAKTGLDEALADLQRRELILEKSRVPEHVYSFKHALTQETAYASLLLRVRRELHSRVGGCLERVDHERVNDIARHFLEAQEHARALPYLVEAGERSARSYSTTEAIGFYTQAVELVEKVEDLGLARRSFEGLGGALTFARDLEGAVENYSKMSYLAEAHDDRPMQVSALNKMGLVTALMQGQLPEGEKHLNDAEHLAKGCGDRAGLAEVHMIYCSIHTSAGDFDNAIERLSEAAQIGRDLGVDEPRLFGLTHIANTMIYMTRFEDAWKAVAEARQLAEKVGNKKYLSELMSLAIPLYHLRNGDLDAAWGSALEGMELAAQIGALANECFAAYMLGQISWLRGEYESAIDFSQRALGASRSAGVTYLQATALCALGTAYLNISEELADRTDEFHAEAMQVLEQPLGSAFATVAWAELGFCFMTLGDMKKANDLFQKGLSIPTAGIHLARPQLLVGSAFVALARSQLDDAEKLVQEGRKLSEASGMKHYYPLIELADAQVSAAKGDMERALRGFTRSERLSLEMGMRPLVWQARAGAAGILSSSGRSSEAEVKTSEASAMVYEIAGLFEDEELRSAYLKSATGKLA